MCQKNIWVISFGLQMKSQATKDICVDFYWVYINEEKELPENT